MGKGITLMATQFFLDDQGSIPKIFSSLWKCEIHAARLHVSVEKKKKRDWKSFQNDMTDQD